MEHAVLLLHCPGCHSEWLMLDTGQPRPDCPTCWRTFWTVSTTWTLAAADWWPLVDGRVLPVEDARRFLWRLSWCARKEHPSGPIGAKLVHLGMQLEQERAPNGDHPWRFARCAGSHN